MFAFIDAFQGLCGLEAREDGVLTPETSLVTNIVVGKRLEFAFRSFVVFPADVRGDVRTYALLVNGVFEQVSLLGRYREARYYGTSQVVVVRHTFKDVLWSINSWCLDSVCVTRSSPPYCATRSLRPLRCSLWTETPRYRTVEINQQPASTTILLVNDGGSSICGGGSL